MSSFIHTYCTVVTHWCQSLKIATISLRSELTDLLFSNGAFIYPRRFSMMVHYIHRSHTDGSGGSTSTSSSRDTIHIDLSSHSKYTHFVSYVYDIEVHLITSVLGYQRLFSIEVSREGQRTQAMQSGPCQSKMTLAWHTL